MKRFQFRHGSLIGENAELPQPGRYEVLIHVHAAGVTPTELRWYPTLHTKTGEPRLAAVPAHEFSGVIVGVGKNVGSLEMGREVFGMNDWFDEGAMAEYCLAPFASVAPKPLNVTHSEAASVPIGALTAWQGLFDHAGVRPGERVLIHGGSGAVGSFAVQLAADRGAHVIATCSERNREFVRNLGAQEVIDYERSRFEQAVAAGVDVVFDTIGGETLDRSWNVLRPLGRLVTIAAGGESSVDERVRRGFFIVEPNQKQLFQIADLIEQGRVRPVVDTVIPFALAPGAYAPNAPRQGRGKLVVSIHP